MALIKCRECGKKFSELAESCPNCGAPMDASGQPSGKEAKMRTTKKIILIAIGGIILLLALAAVGISFVRSTPSYKLKNSDYLTAIDVYYEFFNGKRHELTAIEYLVNAMEAPFSSSVVGCSEYPYFYSSYGSRVINDVSYSADYRMLKNFFQIADQKMSNEITARWASYFEEIDKITESATPLKDIYANPQLYVGKTVIVAGSFCSDNDIKRGMLKIGATTNTFGHLTSDSYPLELGYKFTMNDGTVVYLDKKWENAVGSGEIIACGVLVKYTNSETVYLHVAQMDFLNEADLSSYSSWSPSNPYNLK